MAPTKLPGLGKIRCDSKQIQKAIDFVERTLAEPQRVFDVTKCVSAELIVNDEMQKCIDLSDEVLLASEEVSYNLENGALFLCKLEKFKKDTKDLMDAIESQLKPFGYVCYTKKAEQSPPLVSNDFPGGFVGVDPSLSNLLFGKEATSQDAVLTE